jgi:hypothetical protein
MNALLFLCPVEASVPIILFVYEQKLFNAMPCQRKEFI